MFSKYSKILVSVMLATIITVLSCVSFGAQSYESDDKSIVIYDETIVLNDNEVYCCSYNITQNYKWGVFWKFGDNKENSTEIIWGKDCVENPYVLSLEPDTTYHIYQKGQSGYSGSQKYTFDTTGGEYRKVRYKLANHDAFNEDGSCSIDGINYYFSDDQHIDNGTYSSSLVIVSGGVVNFVAPDENGCVEFYVSTDINERVKYYTDFRFEKGSSSGGMGGTNGGNVEGFTKGITNDSPYSVRISHATEIQRYMAKQHKFTNMQSYRADVDNNDVIDIVDATLIQMYLAKM